ncbi:MAG: amino acid permease [Chitinophagaceae bacterium]|nr:amino acid permease [Chitinophagaceae bacterium]MBL0057033.1 amino acid permease [Chitinophagaceae bacterium]
MANSLFRTKKISTILSEGSDDPHGGGGLKRVLNMRDLTFFGIAAILGAGSFSSLGSAVFNGGPGVVILFVITAIACAFTAFCYSEFASRIPVAGSAYTYAYASFGELFAWVIGWALIMEYSIGNIYVAFSWSDYFTSFLDKLGEIMHMNLHVPDYFSNSYVEVKNALKAGSTNPEILSAWNQAPMIGGLRIILDIPALVINILITYLVYRGVKESRNFSNIMVILKLAVVGLIILVGGYLVFSTGSTHNWLPPDDTGVKNFMPNGFGGVMMAVSSVFFAYIGFDAVSVLAEESKNPQRDLPRGMILSLIICTVIYILLTLVLTGAVNYRNFEGVGDPLSFIFEKQNLNIGWMQFLVSVCAVVAMTSVLLVFQMGQPRIWMSMSRDGLLPPVFQKIHAKFKTPSFATIVTGLVVGIPILFTDKTFVLDFTSIATLFAFVLVCGGVLLIPRKEKIPGKFNLPYINAKFIFPLIIIGAGALASTLSKNYFADKMDFSFEKKVDAFTDMIPVANMDTISTSAKLEEYLVAKNDPDSAFIQLTAAMKASPDAASRISIATDFGSKYNTTQSRTTKISLIIFWLLMIGLAILTVIKNYSLIPLMGVSTCLYLLTGMSLSNWLWFGSWLLVGLVLYFLYGFRKSKLNTQKG